MRVRFQWPAGGSLALFLLAAVSAMPIRAQTPGSTLPAIWGGVYTEQQAARGKDAYGNSCVGCHNLDLSGSRTGPPLTGAAFMTKWES